MGGKDPFIVCSDVADEARRRARGGVWAAFLNAGQVCTSAERFYVMEDVYDDYLQAFVELHRRPRGRRPHRGRAPTSARWSPRRSARRWPTSSRRAVAAGAEVVVGGGDAGHERGHFFAPAVVTGAPAETDLLREETFGPVAPIVRVKSLDEAIELANSTRFGLGANIYTRDLQNVLRCMREIKAGTVWFNDPLTDNDAGPFGGFKQSGLGPRAGPRGPRGLPGDQARPHRDRDRAEGMVVPVLGVLEVELTHDGAGA